jgi:ribosome-binding protein aMBF1 (putative translation factor)
MPTGYPNKTKSKLIAPPQELTAMEQAMHDLRVRMKTERLHYKQRMALVLFLKRNDLLSRRDVNDCLDAVGRGKRQKGDKAVVSRHVGLAVAKVITDARTAKGLTREALGKAVGKSGQAIGNWERGTNPVPDDVRSKLSKVLGISVKALANGDARPHS